MLHVLLGMMSVSAQIHWECFGVVSMGGYELEVGVAELIVLDHQEQDIALL